MASSKQKKEGPSPPTTASATAVTAAPIVKPTSSSSPTLKQHKQHFVPLPLVAIILLCSGSLWMLSLRDLFRTGQVIFGPMDAAMLHFTHSTQWYDDSKGWKSTQGGFSAIVPITTDANNMGGFFVRKLAGAAALTVHSQKLFPILLQSEQVHWGGPGHFDPMLCTAMVGDVVIALFYLSYQKTLVNAGVDTWSLFMIMTCLLEALVIFLFLIHRWFTSQKREVETTLQVTFPEGKTSSSIVSNIVARTLGIVTAVMTLIAGRDFFFPGYDMGFPPKDDIYLEWTGAFIHSPPHGTVEESEYGFEAPLHVGDLFISQLGALYLLIFCFQKIVAGFLIRYGKDASGPMKANVFWRIQCIGDVLLLTVFRAFAASAKSASFDVRWHLMCLGYEACILALYAYF